MKYKLYLLITCSVIFLLSSCKKDPPATGYVNIKFGHYIDGNPLLKDTMIYTNAAGNLYKITELKYFVSDMILHRSDGTDVSVISKDGNIHYIDNDIPGTMNWSTNSAVPEGSYDSITFVFGINKISNHTGLYVNPPEVLMSWPGMLGGGYHYMMLNGKWKDNGNMVQNLNFHLGIGQLYKHDVMVADSIYAFVQNYFSVNIPNSSFYVSRNDTKNIEIRMNIENWFKGNNIFDFNVDGFNIMMRQDAMAKMIANGKLAFTVTSN